MPSTRRKSRPSSRPPTAETPRASSNSPRSTSPLALPADLEAGLKYLRLAALGGLAKAQVCLGNSHGYARFGLAEDDGARVVPPRQRPGGRGGPGGFKVGKFYEHCYGGLEQSEETAKEYYAKGGEAGAAAVWRLNEPERNRAEVQRLTEAADASAGAAARVAS